MGLTPDAILFDLDGVLIDSFRLWYHLQNQAARELGYSPVSEKAYRESWGQSTRADRDTFYPRHSVEEVERFYDAHYFEHLDHLVVAEQIPELFSRLEELSIRTAVVTNTQHSLAKPIVERSGATPDVIVGGDDVPRGKPAPDMVVRACALLGVAPARTWMVGDSSYDRDAARAAGCWFVGVGIEGDRRIERVGELLEWKRLAGKFDVGKTI